jgi:hypothetical protein
MPLMIITIDLDMTVDEGLLREVRNENWNGRRYRMQGFQPSVVDRMALKSKAFHVPKQSNNLGISSWNRLFMQVAPFNIIYRPIPRRLSASLTIPSFRTEFFLPSKPTIVSGCADALPAAKKWFDQIGNRKTFNIQYLHDHASSSKLQVELRNLRTCTLSRITLPFIEAIALLSAQQTGQSWPAHTNAYIAQSSIDDLCKELALDLPTPQIVRETARGDDYGSSLWMGIPPTSTPLHRDPNPNFFVQMAGAKCFRLLDPPNGALVYRTAMGNGTGRIRGAEMLVGEESQLMEEWLWGEKTRSNPLEYPQNKEPLSGGTRIDCWEACLNEGDSLFIPVGWWHSVRGVGEAGSINASVSAE